MVANELKSRRTQVTIYLAAEHKKDSLKLLDPEYDDQISEMIVEHLLFTALNLPQVESEAKPVSKKKERLQPLPPEKELFVSNIVPLKTLNSAYSDDEELRRLFEEFGTVSKIKFIKATFKDETVKAYVIYASDSPNAPQRAISKLNGFTFRDEKLEVEFE